MALIISHATRLHGLGNRPPRNRLFACRASTPLKQQRCEPCEEAKHETEFMGLSNMLMDRATAEKYMEQVVDSCRCAFCACQG